MKMILFLVFAFLVVFCFCACTLAKDADDKLEKMLSGEPAVLIDNKEEKKMEEKTVEIELTEEEAYVLYCVLLQIDAAKETIKKLHDKLVDAINSK